MHRAMFCCNANVTISGVLGQYFAQNSPNLIANSRILTFTGSGDVNSLQAVFTAKGTNLTRCGCFAQIGQIEQKTRFFVQFCH